MRYPLIIFTLVLGMALNLPTPSTAVADPNPWVATAKSRKAEGHYLNVPPIANSIPIKSWPTQFWEDLFGLGANFSKACLVGIENEEGERMTLPKTLCTAGIIGGVVWGGKQLTD